MQTFFPTIVLIVIAATCYARPWQAQDRPPQGADGYTQASCSGALGHSCDATTTIANCDTAMSQACTYATGNDGYPQDPTGTLTIAYPPGDANACVVTVARWPLASTSTTGYDACVRGFQNITMTCFDPSNQSQQKGAGGAVNGLIKYSQGGGDAFTTPSQTLPEFYARAQGCAAADLGMPAEEPEMGCP
ncbi:hypothetical protein MMC24_004117 [Lignoscripta atroalba]|nr:hypothetical protein [Lignoscripta atroalba]